MMTKINSNKRPSMTRREASKILATTQYMQGFHFNTAIGKHTEKTATNLREFAKILETIDESSIVFHFQRQDFQKWIKEILGDSELASRLDKITSPLSNKDLRNKLVETVRKRLTELTALVIK
jgi:hypothetical protein